MENQLFIPAAAAMIAVAAVAALLMLDFSEPEYELGGNGITMITAAVVDRAGATVVPTRP
jgi:hypothetical protein